MNPTWAEIFERMQELIGGANQSDEPWLLQLAADTQSVPPGLKVFTRDADDKNWTSIGTLRPPVEETR